MVEYFPNPEDDESQQEKNREFEEIHASDKDVTWTQDPKSYITIMPYPRKQKIMARIYSVKNEKLYLIDGDTPKQVYYKIIAMGLVTRMEHAAYLGKELQKAYVALKHGLYFNQDDELDFNKKIKD
ncbi:DUF4346 domain-containing protein [Candidatus Woesearchaeota archaeon]|nr:DUF4346 domain-containing protein [Candidatus Woesearchaeota archaeon]